MLIGINRKQLLNRCANFSVLNTSTVWKLHTQTLAINCSFALYLSIKMHYRTST